MFSPAYESGNDNDDQEPDIVGANDSLVYDDEVDGALMGSQAQGRGSKLPPRNSKRKS